MTQNQLKYQQNKETERDNLRKDRRKGEENVETRRSNKVRERIESGKLEETKRHNRAEEVIGGVRAVSGFIPLAGGNDEAWYTPSDAMVTDVASIPFPYALGYPVIKKIMGIAEMAFSPAATGDAAMIPSVPGIMALYYIPGPGYSNDANSALNKAVLSQYTFIRHKNSGSANYELADLGVYNLCVDSALTMLYEAIRVYKMAVNYSLTNRYLGKALVEASHYNFDNIIANLAQFKAAIHTFAFKLAPFVLPSDMPLLKRRAYLASNIFADKDAIKAKTQMYLAVAAGFYKYDPTTEGGGSAVYVPKGGSRWTVNTFESKAKELLDAMIADEDIGIITGDIMKAYGDKVVHVRSDADFTDTALPLIYGDEEFLHQIHNAEVYGDTELLVYPSMVVNADVTQVDNLLYYRPQVKTLSQVIFDHSLDIHRDNPSPGNIMVSTRFKANYTLEGAQDGYLKVTSCGTELPLGVVVYALNNLQAGEYSKVALNSDMAFNFDQGHENRSNVAKMVVNAQFKYGPVVKVYCTYSETPGLVFEPIGVSGEVENLTALTDSQVALLNEVACLGLWNVADQFRLISG